MLRLGVFPGTFYLPRSCCKSESGPTFTTNHERNGVVISRIVISYLLILTKQDATKHYWNFFPLYVEFHYTLGSNSPQIPLSLCAPRNPKHPSHVSNLLPFPPETLHTHFLSPHIIHTPFCKIVCMYALYACITVTPFLLFQVE